MVSKHIENFNLLIPTKLYEKSILSSLSLLFTTNSTIPLVSSSSSSSSSTTKLKSTTLLKTISSINAIDFKSINSNEFSNNINTYNEESIFNQSYLLTNSQQSTITNILSSINLTITTDSINLINSINEYENWMKKCDNVYQPNLYSNLFDFWLCGIILNIVGIFGIIGNIISIIILSRPQIRSGINYLLIGLACFDTILIITSILLFGIPSIYPYTGQLFFYYNHIYPLISPIVFPIAMIAQTASIYMTFTVTLERYIAVRHPLKARVICTYGRAKTYFLICTIFAIIYNMPRFFEVVYISYLPPDSLIVLHCVRPSLLRRNITYINIYIHWCYLIVNYIIPFLTLSILNCIIYHQVKLANRERQLLSLSEKRDIRLATMLICVVIVFFLLNFLALVLNISEAFYNFIDHTLTKISNLLITINSSCNFLIYIIFGEKFKRIFLFIFFKYKFKSQQPNLIHYDSYISNNDIIRNRLSRYFTSNSVKQNKKLTSITNNNHLKRNNEIILNISNNNNNNNKYNNNKNNNMRCNRETLAL